MAGIGERDPILDAQAAPLYFSARVNIMTAPFDKMAASTVMLNGTTHTTASSSVPWCGALPLTDSVSPLPMCEWGQAAVVSRSAEYASIQGELTE
ncbi:MAG: hypothetical protein ACREIJ_01520 [Nitrospiraceae bacterium]